jgi:hypothetical protein
MIERKSCPVPILDGAAAARAAALEGSLVEDERAQGFELHLWPSPESLRLFSRDLVVAMEREDFVTAWLQEILHDLSRLEATLKCRRITSRRRRAWRKLFNTLGTMSRRLLE